MKRFLFLAPLALGVTLFAAAASSPVDVPVQPRQLFGPESFLRTAGAANVYTRSFTVPSYVKAPYSLHLQNGRPGGTGRITDAISSGTVSINGVEIIHKSDFNQNVASIERTVGLNSINTLTVTLNSSPDSFITLTISGVIPLGRLNQPRSGQTAALQADGSVYVSGGRNDSGELGGAERHDPLAMTFTPIDGSLGTARSEHAEAALADGTHLLIAGQQGGGLLAGAERFDPATGHYTGVSGNLRIPRSGHTATALLDGRVLIAGGRGSGALPSGEIYDAQSVLLFKPPFDPAAGVFVVLSNALTSPRWDHTATMLPDGRVLIAGGKNDAGFLTSAEFFDSSTERFIPLASGLTVPRAGHTATLMPDGRVLILGGENEGGRLTPAEAFNPATETFASVAGGLQGARANHTAVLLPFGEVLVSGGENEGGALDTAELVGPPPMDPIAPAVARVTPPDGSVGVDLSEIIGIRFSEPVDVRTLNSSSMALQAGEVAVNVRISPAEQGLMVFVMPIGAHGHAPLQPGTTYILNLTSDVKDTAGNPLVPFTSRFTTVGAPGISALMPNHGPAGTAVTIRGEGFDLTAPTKNVVKFGDVQSVVSSATSGQIETTVPADAPVGPTTLTVTTRGGTTSEAFTVENGLPILSTILPGSISSGSGAFTLTLSGENFIPSSTVNFGDFILTPITLDSRQLQVTVPAEAVGRAGLFPVTVFNPGPGRGQSESLTFSVIQSYSLTVNKEGDGAGLVETDSGGINCGANCQETYPSGTVVTLTASPGADSFSSGFSGGCAGTTASCTFTITQDTVVTAVFELVRLSAIVVTPAEPTVHQGESQAFTATGMFTDGTSRILADNEVTWSSDSPAASITPTGLVTGLRGGTATITATASHVSGRITAPILFSPISGGLDHACTLLENGSVACWGDNLFGGLGNGNTTSSSVPVQVSGISSAVRVSTGSLHTCAVLSDGTVKCWGYNGYGQLGNRTFTSSSIPVLVSGITNAVEVSPGGNHTCALLSDGTVKCWGQNLYGQLGLGYASGSSSPEPLAVSGITTAVGIAAGSNHTCVVLSDSTIKCWGYNNSGQLGNGTTMDSPIPVTVAGTIGAIIAAEGDTTCVVLSENTVKCWGRNTYGQLGNGTFSSSLVPVSVSGINRAVSVEIGGSHTCAVLSDHKVKCWGANFYGQLGNGSTTDSLTPVEVSGISTAIGLGAGRFHTCALLYDHTVKCWGYNNRGSLGSSTTVNSETPVAVSGVTTAETGNVTLNRISGSTTLTIQNPVKLNILSPVNGSQMIGSSIWVEGTSASELGEVGVVVNGVLAQVNGNRFVANHVPLVPGANLITATATDFEGNTASASIAVTSDGLESPITLMANPESGIAPLTVDFSLLTAIRNPITRYTLDADGDGVPEVDQTDIPEHWSFTYTQSGLYQATVTITDDQGASDRDSIAVNVLSLTELDELLKRRWEGMKAALASGNIQTVVSLFSPGTKAKYQRVFEALLPNLAQIANNLEELRIVEVQEGVIECYTTRLEDGVLNGYFVYLSQDSNGLWKFSGM